MPTHRHATLPLPLPLPRQGSGQPAPGTLRMPSLLNEWLDGATPEQQQRRVAAIVADLGFDQLVYGRVRLASKGVQLVSLHTLLGDDGWRREYQAGRFVEVDPRLRTALSSSLPQPWDLAALAAALRAGAGACLKAFLQALERNGMRSGMMVALPGPRADERGVVSLTSRQPQPGGVLDDAMFGRVMMLGACLHDYHTWHASLEDGDAQGGSMPRLSSMQRSVLQLVVEGLGDKQIASRLDVSTHTVDYHMRSLRKLFGVRSRMQLVVRAVQELASA